MDLIFVIILPYLLLSFHLTRSTHTYELIVFKILVSYKYFWLIKSGSILSISIISHKYEFSETCLKYSCTLTFDLFSFINLITLS